MRDRGKITSRQKFKVRTVARRQIMEAAYNPRRIEEEAQRRLQGGIERFGLVEPLVWNERTGNLVGGHQRIKILDAKQGGQDYELTVCAVDVDEATEKKLNIVLNNQSIMGMWDRAALERVLLELASESLSGIEASGFSMEEAMEICGPGDLSQLLEAAQEQHKQEKAESRAKRESAEPQEPASGKGKPKEQTDPCMVVVFPDSETANRFLLDHNLSTDSRYIDGHRFMAAVGLPYTERGLDQGGALPVE